MRANSQGRFKRNRNGDAQNIHLNTKPLHENSVRAPMLDYALRPVYPSQTGKFVASGLMFVGAIILPFAGIYLGKLVNRPAAGSPVPNQNAIFLAGLIFAASFIIAVLIFIAAGILLLFGLSDRFAKTGSRQRP
jgi:hypothetical protein